MSATSDETGVHVWAAFIIDVGDFLPLGAGDALAATVNGVTKTMTLDSTDANAHYRADFDGPASQVVVSFTRTNGQPSAPNSVLTLAAPFTVSAPPSFTLTQAASNDFLVGGLTLSVNPLPDPQKRPMLYRVSGACVPGVVAGSDRKVLPFPGENTENAVLDVSYVLDPTATNCDLTFQIRAETLGRWDPAFDTDGSTQDDGVPGRAGAHVHVESGTRSTRTAARPTAGNQTRRSCAPSAASTTSARPAPASRGMTSTASSVSTTTRSPTPTSATTRFAPRSSSGRARGSRARRPRRSPRAARSARRPSPRAPSALPAPDVVPAEIAGTTASCSAFSITPWSMRDRGQRRERCSQSALASPRRGGRVDRVEAPRRVGQVGAMARHHVAGAEEEHPRVPMVLPAATYSSARARSGFSTKRATAETPSRTASPQLDVAVAGLGARRDDADGRDVARRARPATARCEHRAEARLVGDVVVAREHHHDGLRVRCARSSRSPSRCTARCSARPARRGGSPRGTPGSARAVASTSFAPVATKTRSAGTIGSDAPHGGGDQRLVPRPASGRSCFGWSRREAGQNGCRRPPAMMTAYTFVSWSLRTPRPASRRAIGTDRRRTSGPCRA